MPKKINCCKNWCDKCKRPPIPKDENGFSASKKKNKQPLHWILVFITLCLLGAWIIPEIKDNEDYEFNYFPPNISKLKAKQPAIHISCIDFQSDIIRERFEKLTDKMIYVCRERSDDVVFAFQFGTEK